MPSLRRASTRDVVLIVLALLAISGAVLFAMRSSDGEDPAPTDVGSQVTFVCEGCGEFFALNGKEVEDAMRAKRTAIKADGRTMMFPCPKCKSPKGVRAAKCPQHGDVIKITPGASEPEKCSKCDFRG